MSSSPAADTPLGASRTDEHRRIRVQIEFSDTQPDRMIGFLHTPLDPPTGGVVLCSSLHAEMMGNYRKEVLLAEALAAQGLAVQRFHYRGTGNSGGLDADVTLDSMQDDARTWYENLLNKTAVSNVGYFGVRFGALAAASAASVSPGAPLALWQPVLDPQLYFREIFRSQLMREMKSGKAPEPGSRSLEDKLGNAGIADVLGYSIHQSLYKSSIGRRLQDELGTDPRPALVVQIAREAQLSPDLASLITDWEEAGWRPRSHVEVHEPAWWFVGEDWKAEELRDETTSLVDVTCHWLAEQVGGMNP